MDSETAALHKIFVTSLFIILEGEHSLTDIYCLFGETQRCCLCRDILLTFGEAEPCSAHLLLFFVCRRVHLSWQV